MKNNKEEQENEGGGQVGGAGIRGREGVGGRGGRDKKGKRGRRELAPPVCVPGEKTGPSCCSTSHHTQPRETPFVVVAGVHDSVRGVMGDEGRRVWGVGGLSTAAEFNPLGPRESVATGERESFPLEGPGLFGRRGGGRCLSLDRPRDGRFTKTVTWGTRPQLGPARHFCSHRRSVSLDAAPSGHAVCHFPLCRHTQSIAHWIPPLTPDL